ncbi:Putative auto-transporter adhesin, head GIN domain [Mariniphaga anaerophila]|uniref:Putative auto-transporter adhesin, head GIN domain n=1 Tax=Mariniphaga anaerophila TaxID=1484053 RepID=A0A1M5CMY7_9BACT|nr:head GIN domain-containing protein [Mariniphaga anaerophila]SHF56124.1 Putative auto-transporter adhesin, head GIN domain [Mariniphaga anaerophila]
MKKKQLFLSILMIGLLAVNTVFAEGEERSVPSFAEVSLRISGNLYLTQGEKQSVKIVAKQSVLDQLITEVRGRSLVVRFKTNNIFKQNFQAGKIEIFVTVPEINALSVSGSGDIVADQKIKSRILDLAVSGSGDILLKKLDSERVKAAVSGSGDITIGNGSTNDLSVTISGSGNMRAERFEAENVEAAIAGSGNCVVNASQKLKARIAGSGNVKYAGNPQIDTSVLGSGTVTKL